MDGHAEETNGGSTGLTNKEMWVRVDAKLDTLVARQQHFDVELALLKERQHQAEVLFTHHDKVEEEDRRAIAASLDAAERKMAEEVQNLKDGQFTLGRAVKYATAIIIAAMVTVDAVVRFTK